MKNRTKRKRNSRCHIIPVLFAFMLAATGCGAKLPQMTDSEYDAVVNYAAGLLMRYNKDTTDRLTFLDTSYTPEHLAGADTQALVAQQTQPSDTTPQPVTPPPADTTSPDSQTNSAQTPPADTAGNGQTAESENPAQEGTEPENPVQDNTEPENPVQDNMEPGNSGADDMEQTNTEPGSGQTQPAPADEPVSDIPSGEPVPESQTPADTPVSAGVPVEASSLQSLAGGATIEYTGYSVRNAYPDSQTQGAVAAAYGDKLLVVDFTIHNLTGNAVRFNTASLNPQFKLQINGNVQGFTMVTMIANDLGGMDTEIAPGARTDAVLLMEVPESLAKNVDTLDLIVVRGAEAQTIKLE